MKKRLTPQVWAWAFYDWANSAFVTTVVAAFFPIFFKKYWSEGVDPTVSTFYLGTAMSAAALLFAASAPILGIFADFYGFKKRGLVVTAIMGSLLTCGFYFVNAGQWGLALILYGLAWICFTGSNLFYDSLLVEVTSKEHYNFVSGFGFGLGYLGGGILIVINSLMVTQPTWFGLANDVAGAKWSFFTVGLWWFVFTIPTMFYIPESKPLSHQPGWSEGFKQLVATFKDVLKHRNLLYFLVAYFFYIDGIGTIYKMAVDFAMALKFDSGTLIKAIVIVQFVGFPSAILYSMIANKIGTKVAIMMGLVAYTFICLMGAFMTSANDFYLLAVGLGLVQGGVQALSRSLYGVLIPHDRSAEYFGFYNMFGKFSAILGPQLVGLTALVTGSSRASIIVIVVFFFIGGSIFLKVKVPKGV